MVKALFIPCTLDGLPPHTGSRLLRCEWVAKYWDGAAVYDGTQRLTDFQVYIFQKAYLSAASFNMFNRLADWRDAVPACQLVFDLCDPDFLDARSRQRLLQVLPRCDWAVAPTQPLVDWLAQYLPAYVIPDGIDPTAIPQNSQPQQLTPRIVWMGYQAHRAVLAELADTMLRLGVTGDMVSVTTPLPFAAFVAQMSEYDILLNPRAATGPSSYKSDNKTLVAWQAGVAVARDGAELEYLLPVEKRVAQIAAGREFIKQCRLMPQIVQAWHTVCAYAGLF